jgi:hypothetical protein
MKKRTLIFLGFILILLSCQCWVMGPRSCNLALKSLKIKVNSVLDCYELSINGNDALASIATLGNGTAQNPFIIGNITLDYSCPCVEFTVFPSCATHTSIHIQNTNKYFILQNCTFYCNSCYDCYSGSLGYIGISL